MKNNSIKRYSVVYNDIIGKIMSGAYKVGEKLPTEIELTESYGVSRSTVAHAMKDLSDANLIYRVKGRGTYVNGKLNRSAAPLIIPTILPFDTTTNDIVNGIQSTALSYNVFSPACNTRNNIEHERHFLKDVLKNGYDGVIVYPRASFENLDLFAEILSRGIPIVCIDRAIEGLDTPLVTTTNDDCMRKIVDRLVLRGHKKIGFFAIDDMMASTEQERFRGFCRGLIEHKLPIVRDYIFTVNGLHRREMTATPDRQNAIFRKYVREALQKYSALEEKPTAICCLNDSMLEAIVRIAESMGIPITQEVTLTGFDSTDPERTKKLGYLCAGQDFFRIGSAAITLMMKLLRGEPCDRRVLVEGILIN